MRAALLIAGYSRTFLENIPLIKKNIINRFETVDVYLHLTISEIEEDAYLNPAAKIDLVCVEELRPKAIVIERNQFAGPSSYTKLLNYWRKFRILGAVKSLNESYGSNYDIVIKTRPDLFLTDQNIFNELEVIKTSIIIPSRTKFDSKKRAVGDYEPTCDSFAFGSSWLMDKLLTAFDYFAKNRSDDDKALEVYFSEFIHKMSIPVETRDIEYHYVMSRCNAIAIAGDSASGKSTLASRLKKHFTNSFVLECDRYHKWERGDKRWDSFTHLHPDANYISKIHEDVFDLKIGNAIYQVDYDHKVGKFTEPEEINPAENLIVCGLHAISAAPNELFDLSIFLEPQQSLRSHWKVIRDTTSRGRPIQDVMQQIDSRRNDYASFIEPQRQNADLVIGVFTTEDTDYKPSHVSFETSRPSLKTRLGQILGRVSISQPIMEHSEEGCNKYLVKIDGSIDWLKIEQTIGALDSTFWDLVLFVILSLASKKETL